MTECIDRMIVHTYSANLPIHTGLGAAEVDPPSGSVIARFEGTVNVTTLTCNVTDNQGNQAVTTWSIGNFRGVFLQTIDLTLASDLFLFGGTPVPSAPNFTFDNQLTILRLTSELDGVVLYCGIGGDLQQANFNLRIYRKYL